MNGRARTATSEDTKTTSPRRRSTMPGTKALTSRCAPTTARSSSRATRSGSISTRVPGDDRPGVADQHLDRAELALHGLRERLDAVPVGHVQGRDDRLATGGPDPASDLLELLRPTGPEGDREPGRGEDLGGGRADPGRRSGDHRRPAVGLVVPAHGQRPFTVIGTEAKPRTLTECTRRQPSWSTSSGAHPAYQLVRATRASSRARLAPRQKCRPPPKLSSRDSSSRSRRRSYSSGPAEHPLVAVRGAEAEQDLRALRAPPCRAARRPRAGSARASGCWCRTAASPRSSGTTSCSSGRREDLVLLLGVAGQVEDRVAQQLGGRLVSGDDHEEQEADDLLVGQPVAVERRRRSARW